MCTYIRGRPSRSEVIQTTKLMTSLHLRHMAGVCVCHHCVDVDPFVFSHFDFHFLLLNRALNNFGMGEGH